MSSCSNSWGPRTSLLRLHCSGPRIQSSYGAAVCRPAPSPRSSNCQGMPMISLGTLCNWTSSRARSSLPLCRQARRSCRRGRRRRPKSSALWYWPPYSKAEAILTLPAISFSWGSSRVGPCWRLSWTRVPRWFWSKRIGRHPLLYSIRPLSRTASAPVPTETFWYPH